MFMTHKPNHLPQLSIPYNILVDKLNDNGIEFEEKFFDPNTLRPTQGIVYYNEYNGGDGTEKPISCCGLSDDENNILDGHHRWVDSLVDYKPIRGIKLKLSIEDAIRVLNKIQDIFEYENVSSQGNFNFDGNDLMLDNHSNDGGVENVDNPITVFGYRNKPIENNSVIGNFFILKPNVGYDKYEIKFDKLLDTDTLGLVFMNGQNPIDILAKTWFPNVDFNRLSNENGLTPENIKSKLVADRAKKMGYDGIKYGDKLIQGLK